MKTYTLGKQAAKNLNKAFVYSAACIFSVIFLFPIFWTVTTSLKATGTLFTYPPQWFPHPVKWSNYLDVFKDVPFARFIVNTFIITFFSTIGTVVSSVLVAYGFARFKFRGRNVLFGIVLSMMFLPAQIIIIPQFIMFYHLNWIDTFYPLIVPNWFAVQAFPIFIMRQFLMGLPKELDEAAVIDGCNSFAILRKIIIPLSRSAILVVIIFSVTFTWNSLLQPLIYLQSIEKFTIVLGLKLLSLTMEGDSPQYQLLMASTLISIAPVFVLFFSLQKYFIRGIAISGRKG
ncbi:MAG: carbohydrate ABC transporter permease [Spirochaetes bacterium]|nr:carbohydrate ABC transporter permease [Spirochaetota bacterium]